MEMKMTFYDFMDEFLGVCVWTLDSIESIRIDYI